MGIKAVNDRLALGLSGRAALLLALLIVMAPALDRPAVAQSSDQVIMLVQPKAPATTAWMLSAPHVGQKVCEIAADTPVGFLSKARHGPHRYAKVEVLDGACAGELGYVAWALLETVAAGAGEASCSACTSSRKTRGEQ